MAQIKIDKSIEEEKENKDIKIFKINCLIWKYIDTVKTLEICMKI